MRLESTRPLRKTVTFTPPAQCGCYDFNRSHISPIIRETFLLEIGFIGYSVLLSLASTLLLYNSIICFLVHFLFRIPGIMAVCSAKYLNSAPDESTTITSKLSSIGSEKTHKVPNCLILYAEYSPSSVTIITGYFGDLNKILKLISSFDIFKLVRHKGISQARGHCVACTSWLAISIETTSSAGGSEPSKACLPQDQRGCHGLCHTPCSSVGVHPG